MIAMLHILRRMFRIRYYPHDERETYEADKLAKLLHKVRRPWWK